MCHPLTSSERGTGPSVHKRDAATRPGRYPGCRCERVSEFPPIFWGSAGDALIHLTGAIARYQRWQADLIREGRDQAVNEARRRLPGQGQASSE